MEPLKEKYSYTFDEDVYIKEMLMASNGKFFNYC